MAISIEFRQANVVLCTIFDLKNAETMKGDRSGCNWLQQRGGSIRVYC
jgi:hypothetical protein